MSRKISVIMSVYNGEKYLEEAIDSVLGQSYPNKEIIVVNDGSTDRTQAILEKLSTKIISIHQENRGLGSGRNTAINIATGEYFSFLDCDDQWTQDKLLVQMNAMEVAYEEDPLIFSYVQQFICPSMTEQEQAKISVDTSFLPGYIAGTLLISKRRFHQVGYFCTKKIVGEFIDWYLRAQEMRLPMQLLSHLALLRRVHQSNMGRNGKEYPQNSYLHILKESLDRRRRHLCTM